MKLWPFPIFDTCLSLQTLLCKMLISCFRVVWLLCLNCYKNASVLSIFSMIFFSMIRHWSLFCSFVAVCKMLVFLFVLTQQLYTFKTCIYCRYSLSFCYFQHKCRRPLLFWKPCWNRIKISTISYPHSVMQIMRLSIFVIHIILLIQAQHPLFKITTTNALRSI